MKPQSKWRDQGEGREGSGRARCHVVQGLGGVKIEGPGNKAWGGSEVCSLSARVCARVHSAKAAVPYLMQMEKMQFLVSVP